MNGLSFWRGTWIIAALELRQRRRSRTLWIFAIVWFVIIGLVSGVTWFSMTTLTQGSLGEPEKAPLFSIIVYFVLFFGSLVAPAISAGSIGAERAGGTLATTQTTLVGTWSILLGKALAAWVTGLAFLVIALPFIALSLAFGAVPPRQAIIAVLALALQLGLFTAIGVGLSACISSQVFAIVTTYLVVALLSVGTLIALSLAIASTTEEVRLTDRVLTDEYFELTEECTDDACHEAVPRTCEDSPSTYTVAHGERFWWILSMNPYVVLGDMVAERVPMSEQNDLFGYVSNSARSMQIPQEDPTPYNGCAAESDDYQVWEEEDLSDTTPVWWMGLSLQGILAGISLSCGYFRLRTPARKLPQGTRVA